MAMDIEEAISGIAAARDHDELVTDLQTFIETMGFSSFCFVDANTTHQSTPFHIGSDPNWDSEYATYDFVTVDQCIAKARRTNTPFSWGSVPLPTQRGRRKPGAKKLMEAATDHGFKEGLVVPFHFVDEIGRPRSMLCSLFWRDADQDFYKSMDERAWMIHIYLIYWMQKSIEHRLSAQSETQAHYGANRSRYDLTDRERDVLSWASRGKTVADTAQILGISTDTVETHMRNAIQRLGAGNKTHAVAKAILVGSIDL